MDKKSWELSLEQVSESRKFDLYNKYVYSQRAGFERLIYFINDLTNQLKEEGHISDLFEIRARIKAPKSAIHNDEQKALDDVFGIEIITATEEELKIIKEKIKEYMIVIREKNHNKKNGYKASHQSLSLKSDYVRIFGDEFRQDEIPIIEIQFKTMEVSVKASVGTAAHTDYKGESKEEVQRKYDNGEYSIFTNVPTMWISRNGEITMLSTDETLKKMYPFLKIKEKDSEKGDKK